MVGSEGGACVMLLMYVVAEAPSSTSVTNLSFPTIHLFGTRLFQVPTSNVLTSCPLLRCTHQDRRLHFHTWRKGGVQSVGQSVRHSSYRSLSTSLVYSVALVRRDAVVRLVVVVSVIHVRQLQPSTPPTSPCCPVPTAGSTTTSSICSSTDCSTTDRTADSSHPKPAHVAMHEQGRPHTQQRASHSDRPASH